ncbi:hypothetical protein J3459_010539 [Metarhizium acridum]|nr:hypothetical protein J3459_010539 [Metarhizium acridum]
MLETACDIQTDGSNQRLRPLAVTNDLLQHISHPAAATTATARFSISAGNAPHVQNTRRSPSVNTFSTHIQYATARCISDFLIDRPPPFHLQPLWWNNRAAVQLMLLFCAGKRRQSGAIGLSMKTLEWPAQQKAAKMRANLEVVGGGRGTGVLSLPSRTNTGISATGKVAARSGIMARHLLLGMLQAIRTTSVLVACPLRLSATEVEGESSDDDDTRAASRAHHRRTGSSGRSSIGSGRAEVCNIEPLAAPLRLEANDEAPGGTPERTGSLIERPERTIDDSASGRSQSSRSASSGERADNVGELGSNPKLAINSQRLSVLAREKSVKSADELKRRGQRRRADRNTHIRPPFHCQP